MSAHPEIQTPFKIQVSLRSVTDLADDIRGFEFIDPTGAPLPPFSAGSHIDVHLPGGLIRQYSLCNDPAESHRYVVAVLRDVNSRGGSVAMHDQLQAGSTVTISSPRSHFSLSTETTRHIFLAGGIGVTPMMAMIAAVQARGESFHLYYFTRSPQRTAFLQELQPLIARGQVTISHDGGDPGNAFALKRILAQRDESDHLYYCGPAGFMTAVGQAASDAGWPAEMVHFEHFGAPTQSVQQAQAVPETAFDVTLAKSGQSFQVPPGQSIVDVLTANGIDVDVSCRDGYCGTCMTRFLDGQPLHRDTVLDDDDRKEFVMICCCRAKGDRLILDM